jgi:hypothetical protein
MDPAPSSEPEEGGSQQTQLLVWRMSKEKPLWATGASKVSFSR